MPDRNGANRGGARPGAGRKKKSLTERIEAGQKATVLKIPEVETAQMPKIKDYFKAEQRMGELYAAEIYEETWQWLNEAQLCIPHQPDAAGAVRHERSTVGAAGEHQLAGWLHHEDCAGCCDGISVRGTGTGLYETDQPAMVPNLSNRQGELFHDF